MPGEQLTVADFLVRVRRMVVAFVVSNLLAQEDEATYELDDPTTYYLLHRNDFGLEPAPAGACILYALSCNLADSDLAGRLDLLTRGGRRTEWRRRRRGRGRISQEAKHGSNRGTGAAPAISVRRRKTGRTPPLIDCVHKLMQLWKTGEQSQRRRHTWKTGA